MKGPRQVDVIVPVYNAADDARRCVDSVLANTGGAFRLIVIDDASPDASVGEWLADLEALGRSEVAVLRNERNLGFVGTANRGMSMSRNDVVLLNSDTLVGGRWLEKILRCAGTDDRIGTITPFSNNAEICSFPGFCVDNPWPEDGDVELTNRALEAVSGGIYAELPTGVGFCMFIRREVLDACGVFDPAYGRGYGEENDLCMRAAKAGFRNVLCADTFVVHYGSRSFDSSKLALSERNMQILLDRHPEYLDVVRAYIAEDPNRTLRDLASMHRRALASELPGVLHIIHPAERGGTELHARSLIDGMSPDVRGYLAVVDGVRWRLCEPKSSGQTEVVCGKRDDESWGRFLGRICATLRIDVCHLHNLSGARQSLLEALSESGVRYGYTVHDLGLACPTITLLDADGRYCGGETDVAKCRSCLSAQSAYSAIDIGSWRRQHQRLIDEAKFVIAPSRWAADSLGRYFGRRDVAVVPHSLPPNGDRNGISLRMGVVLPDDDVPTVAVVGALGPDKGARRLETLIGLTRQRRAKLRWVVIGYLDWTRGPLIEPDGVLVVHGRYERADLPDLLAHYRVRLVAYPSAGPETFSYTLSEVWSAGYPVIVPPIGALGERVADTGAGVVFEDWTDESAMLDQIVALVDASQASPLDEVRSRVGALSVHRQIDMCGATLAAYRPFFGEHASREPSEDVLTIHDVADETYRSPGGGGAPSPAAAPGGVPAHPGADPESRPLPGGRELSRDAPLKVLARAALRVRLSRYGHVLAKMVPDRVRAMLRAHLS